MEVSQAKRLTQPNLTEGYTESERKVLAIIYEMKIRIKCEDFEISHDLFHYSQLEIRQIRLG